MPCLMMVPKLLQVIFFQISISVSKTMSIMFVGSAEQWHATSGKSGDNQRANFILSHKNIFQVRANVFFDCYMH